MILFINEQLFITLTIIIVNYVYGLLNLQINSEINSPAPSTINRILTTDETNNFPLVTVITSMLI